MNKKVKPRNPFVATAKFRNAGSHTKPLKSLRRREKQALAKTAKQSPESWHKCISSESTYAMTPGYLGFPRVLSVLESVLCPRVRYGGFFLTDGANSHVFLGAVAEACGLCR